MNTGNWKTAINGRDRKKRGSDKPGQKQVSKEPSFESSNPYDGISAAISNTKKESIMTPVNGTASHEKKSVVGTSVSNSETVAADNLKVSSATDSAGNKSVVHPEMNYVVAKSVDDTNSAHSAPVKQSWGEEADSTTTLQSYAYELEEHCHSFKERIAFITSTVASMLLMGIDALKVERARIDENKNEKNFVRDLHSVCTHGRELAVEVSNCAHNLLTIVDAYEAEKNKALDELKSFVLGMTDSKPNVTPRPAPLVIGADTPKRIPFDGKYSSKVAPSAPASVHSLDVVTVNLGLASLQMPIARNKNDMRPMSIKYAPDLGVFLLSLDDKTYSFCNGLFISRLSKTDTSTQYGKRCNPSVARCIGAECTYYHDPLMHSNGHTTRNMGVHYVVSELINGVSTDADIIETARGRNKYIVEDIVQLAGMLLIKAFLVKKAREERLSPRDEVVDPAE